MSTIAERLREFRAAVGLTQREVAALCGLGKRTIIYWEMGEREIKCSKLVPLVDEYDLDFNWLILGRGQMFNMGLPLEEDLEEPSEIESETETLYDAETPFVPESESILEAESSWDEDSEVPKPEQEDVLTLIQRLRRKQ